jgi:hypothetical protein
VSGSHRFSETLFSRILCRGLRAGIPATKLKVGMEAISIELPAGIAKPISAGCPRTSVDPKLLIKRCRERCWCRLFRFVQAILNGLVDSSPYQQASLGREISVAFTSQGPVLYRHGLVNPESSISDAFRESAFRTADSKFGSRP